LLHHPELSAQVANASTFADEENVYSQLLVALIDATQKNPKLRTMQLIARWHGTDQGRLLRQLAEKEWLISADNLEQQFFDTITSLSARQRERHLEQLIRKERQSGLSAEEKVQLLNLLNRKVPAQTPTSTGV
jgi:DNA primase